MKITRTVRAKVMERSRKKKLEHFFSMCNRGMNVLDVGVSSEKYKGESTLNYFLKNFPYPATDYTGLGIHDLSGMEQLFPQKNFVQYSGTDFPFEDNQFDWVFSNAVIEHVGCEQEQIKFVNEMFRVGKNVFFTTPNKYFPIESHTQVAFLHWNDDYFYKWLKKNKPHRSRNNLNLLSKQKLREILEKSQATNYKIRSNLFLFLPMTFTVVCPDSQITAA